MIAITATAYSRTAPRGAVIAAEVFVRLQNVLRVAFARATSKAAERDVRSAFPA
jgi:hypothetical protein